MEWWDSALTYIKRRSDFNLSREMNFISKEIMAWRGFEKLKNVSDEIADDLMRVESELLR